ncbi:putative C4-dicarboxylate transporter [Actinoplanes missouriensis 431]|uniref:Putative C4-dicarboxylate transporter n=1 Tax=Actinoplanes missouriensis (strain ATCC 14538 / DSM 43046 / CBS 188.64 / JCM 3121 / NBRC 102363 / NCIMB 12654 / NRRL B-3342 / UNCC 431) TaxID=512565 RepID=I0H8U9_ACTM4|nr:TDT family transporter [Actinoplanes missouriensis]BAL89436.1 putative C4-dicarboxylate transporter [Actinoplanes missouriensis 431]
MSPYAEPQLLLPPAPARTAPVPAPASLTPNWFASVMATGIVATAAVSLPSGATVLRPFATAVWLLAAALLTTLLVIAARQRRTVVRHAADPVLAHFYGAPPMALLTVGAGTLLLGPDPIGDRAAVAVAATLWVIGTLTGLLAAVAVPYLRFTRHATGGTGEAFGGWLMPVVAPMVSATTGAPLVPHAPAGQIRLTLLLGCYAMFGLSLIAALIVTTLIWQRLALHTAGPAGTVPTLWIVLGPIGQAITAANALGGVAATALPHPYPQGFAALGVVLGVPLWGFAALWGSLALAVTVRTARRGLPFSLTWWSFTFPVGTCVTGTSALAAQTGATMFRVVAVLLYAALVTAWLTVGVRTLRMLRPAISRAAG